MLKWQHFSRYVNNILLSNAEHKLFANDIELIIENCTD